MFYWISLFLVTISCFGLAVNAYREYLKNKENLNIRLNAIINLGLVGKELKSPENELLTRLAKAITGLYLYKQTDLLLIRSGLSISVLILFVLSAALIISEYFFLWIMDYKVNMLLINAFTIIMIFVFLKAKALYRKNIIEKQLPDIVDYISSSLKVGNSIEMTFKLVGDEFNNVCSDQFKKVHEEIEFGTHLKDALSNLIIRVDSKHIRYMVVAIFIQHESGGNLLETMDQISSSLRARVIIDRKIKALTAEGRASAILISSMPIIMAGLQSWLNPQYMRTLWYTPEGVIMLEFGIIIMAAGGLWIWKLVQIKM